MRIAYLVNQYPSVSHTFIRREILALERIGFEVFRIALRDWSGELLNPEDRSERKRTRYVLEAGIASLLLSTLQLLLTRPVRFVRALFLAMRMSRRSDRPLSIHLVYLAEACRIVPWLKAAGVEHLHAHFGTNPAEVAMQAHVLGGPTWSFTVHGPEEFDKPQFIGLAEKVRRCSFVVAISSYGQAQLLRFINQQDWSKVNVVHCGLDAAHLAQVPRPLMTTHRLVCVGRLSAQKGQLCLIDASARLVAKGVPFELVLVGDGEMRHDVEARISHHNLQPAIQITGWLSSEEVDEQILSARALVLPSFAEGLPVVIMEAMALRRPIISTFVAGIPELVEPGQTGWLVPAGDVEKLATAMQACLEMPLDQLTQMGQSARERVMKQHDVNTEAVKLSGLIRLHANHVSDKR